MRQDSVKPTSKARRFANRASRRLAHMEASILQRVRFVRQSDGTVRSNQGARLA